MGADVKIERKRTATAVQSGSAASYRISALMPGEEQDVKIEYIVTLTAQEVRDALLSFIEEHSALQATSEGGESARLVIHGEAYPVGVAVRVEWEGDADDD